MNVELATILGNILVDYAVAVVEKVATFCEREKTSEFKTVGAAVSLIIESYGENAHLQGIHYSLHHGNATQLNTNP